MKKVLSLFLLGIILIAGCAQKEEAEVADKETAIAACIEECQKWSKSRLTDGPCLSNIIAEGWVCDVAHDPIQPVDNLVENQCFHYVQGLVKHFVELDTNCKLIKAY